MNSNRPFSGLLAVSQLHRSFIVLEDGTIFAGQQVGGSAEPRVGEVVFNTSHSGYEEIASDPSYLNQIVVMTQPMQGNYGSDRTTWESRKFWIQGFVCLQVQNTKRNSSWLQTLIENNVPVLTEIDTRKLVLKLRSQGTPWGAIVRAESESEARTLGLSAIETKKVKESDWVYLASRKQIEDRPGKNPKGPRIAVLDFGCKENILRELEAKCSLLRIFPSRTTPEVISSFSPDGIMLTNGPGDPASAEVAPATVRSFLGHIPIFGICMGHQILALALGAKTYKLKFGHRGANHPIKDLVLNRIYMSSQNHGYAVDRESLPTTVGVTHINLNDQSVAGFYSESLKCLGIQYHPEASPGPHEARELFDYYFSILARKSEGKSNDRLLTV